MVDVSKIVDDFRATVLEDISRQAAASERKFTFRTANELYEAFKENPDELHSEYAIVMSFGGRDASQVQAELSRIGDEVKALQVPVAMLLAQRIAKADVGEARRLIWKSKLAKP